MSEHEHDLAAALGDLPDEALVPVGWVRARLAAPAPREAVVDLSCADVAAQLGRTPGAVRAWCASGELKGSYKLNRREWRVPQAALRRYLDEQATRHQPEQAAGPVDLGAWRHVGVRR